MEVPVEGMEKNGRVYRQSTVKRIFWASFLVALYAVVIPYCLRTAGEPRAAAALAAQEKADAKWAGYNNITATDSADVASAQAQDDTSVFGEETSLDMGDLLSAAKRWGYRKWYKEWRFMAGGLDGAI